MVDLEKQELEFQLELSRWVVAVAAKDRRIETLKEELKAARLEREAWEQRYRDAVERIQSLTGGVT